MSTIAIDRWKLIRYNAFHWRCELSVTQKLALAMGMAVLTGLLAQVRAPLPWTPVPITGQTLAVLLAGVLLGRWWGGISQAIYAGLGIAGVPWFTGWQGGISHLAGPTGGYIIGFIMAALFIGYITDKFVSTRSFPNLFILMMAANFVLVYVPGLVQLDLWMNLISGKSTSLAQVISMGLLPFVIGDIIKIALVAGIAWGIIPKQAYDTKY